MAEFDTPTPGYGTLRLSVARQLRWGQTDARWYLKLDKLGNKLGYQSTAVRTSRVLEQTDGRVRLEQEAVSKFMMISRTVHLVLDVEESDGAIRFRDDCHKSFVVYDGSWTITPQGSGTELVYELTAKPAFSVPGMVLRKLLDRDAREMIDGLRAEIALRASSRF